MAEIPSTFLFPTAREPKDWISQFSLGLQRQWAFLAHVINSLNAVGSYTAADTTPSVLGTFVLPITNAGPISITTFDDGADGQEVTLIFTDANTTLVDGASLQLAGGVNFVSSADDTLTLLYRSGVWYEKCRSVN